ncbi:MAG: hypothetical protein KJZ65_01365 [Phycisphaerales bacterium]|nr:hypothetical protein [Phycisphaerales bacterium]
MDREVNAQGRASDSRLREALRSFDRMSHERFSTCPPTGSARTISRSPIRTRPERHPTAGLFSLLKRMDVVLLHVALRYMLGA